MARKGNVYLLYDIENNLYKIGFTRGTVEKRLSQLQTGNATKLSIIRTFECEHPSLVEHHLHTKFSGKQVLNEWYDLEDEDVFSFLESCETIRDSLESVSENPFFMKHLGLT